MQLQTFELFKFVPIELTDLPTQVDNYLSAITQVILNDYNDPRVTYLPNNRILVKSYVNPIDKGIIVAPLSEPTLSFLDRWVHAMVHVDNRLPLSAIRTSIINLIRSTPIPTTLTNYYHEHKH